VSLFSNLSNYYPSIKLTKHCVSSQNFPSLTELLSRKNKTCHTVKMSAWYVAHDTMRDLHASEAWEKAEHAKEATEKEAQKAEEVAACNARI
jgi:hypothetical protein